MVDLPAPVLPTTPTFSPAFILKVRFLRERGRSILYLALMFLNSMSPRCMMVLCPYSIGDQF